MRPTTKERSLTLPVWMLVGFAAWTVLLLVATVGIYRWSRILTGRVPIRNFRADQIEGKDWYKRAMRAHANCVENLPVFGAIVFGLHVGNVSGVLVNTLAVAILVARIMQSLVHVCFDQTNAVTFVRFWVLCRADRQFSRVDWDPPNQVEWNAVAYPNTLGASRGLAMFYKLSSRQLFDSAALTYTCVMRDPAAALSTQSSCYRTSLCARSPLRGFFRS